MNMKTFLAAASTREKKSAGTDFPGTARDLMRYIEALPVDNPRTGDTIIVSSYTTNATRMLRHFWNHPNGTKYPVTALTKAECAECVPPIPIDQYEAMLNRGRQLMEAGHGFRSYELRIKPHLFNVAIWDEVHRLRGFHTQQIAALLWQKFRRVLLLTASPCMRRLRDLTTILKIIAEVSVVGEKGKAAVVGERTVRDYVDFYNTLVACGGSFLHADEATRAYLATALDPDSYSALMGSFDESGVVVRQVVPAVLAIISCRRVSGQTIKVMGRDHVIAGNIPPFHCTVVELEPNDHETLLYQPLHKEKCGEDDVFRIKAQPHARPEKPLPGAPPPDPETEIRENVDKRRRLQAATCSLRLEQLARYQIPGKAKDVQRW
jgi:hypothetical protein